MEVTLWHGLEYEVEEPVAIEDLIKSLEANARLLRQTSTLLSDLVPGISLEPKRISVSRLSQESPLRELLAYTVVLAFQKDLDKEVPPLIEQITGVEVGGDYDTLVTVLVMIIAIYGISKAFDRVFPGRDKTPLDATQKTLLEQAARLLGVAAQRILDAVSILFTGKQTRSLITASQRVFAPTRGQARPNIRARDGAVLMPHDAVSLAQAASGIPYEAEEDESAPKIESEFHYGVRIILHAMDRDRKRVGWAGHVPSLFDDRIPMHLEKSMKPEAIFGKSEITGDILLTKEEDENGDMQPKEFLLVRGNLG